MPVSREYLWMGNCFKRSEMSILRSAMMASPSVQVIVVSTLQVVSAFVLCAVGFGVKLGSRNL